MARYVFVIENGFGVADETATAEYPDMDMVRREAARYFGQLMIDHPRELWDGRVAALVVRDEAGLVLLRIDVVATDAPALV